jgi:tRNA pseudouridine38-40 synthase
LNFYYKLTLQYKGTDYLGWQIQPEHYGRTIQGELERATRVVAKTENIKTLGSGRTDAGVHAIGQVVKLTMPLQIDPQNLIPALNVNLPDDIRVVSSELTTENFHPTFQAISKEYHYCFTAEKFHSALGKEFVANYPYQLNMNLMQEACKELLGTHDFVNFFTEGTDVSSTIREIYNCEIEFVEAGPMSILPGHFKFKIVGNGFLKQMVRLLVGAIWNIGRGKVLLEDFKKALEVPKTHRLGPVAPPEGLYLARVNY